MKQKIKKIWLALALALGVLLVLNLGFFWQNLKYTFFKPTHPARFAEVKSSYDPDMLRIESLGIKTPIIYVEGKSEAVYQKALQKGVVHFPGTALPGQYGNVYIFGHSSDFAWSPGEYKTIFALLPRIQKGDKVVLTDGRGNPFTYLVTDSFVARARDIELLDQGEYKKRRLTLQTSYPIGTALMRWIVIAEMEGDETPSPDPNAS